MANKIIFTILEIIFITFFGVGVSGMGFEYYPSWFVFFSFLGFSSTTYLFAKSFIQERLYKQIDLATLRAVGKKWGKRYKYLKSVFLFKTFSGVPRPDETQSKYTLYFKFKKSTVGKADEEKFNDLTWNPEMEAYPISECKDEIYKTDPSEIDLLYEWSIVTEKPKAVDKKSCFIVYKKKLMGIT